MKKYIITYVAIFLVAILLIITKGIPWELVIAFIGQRYVFDGFAFGVCLLPGNILIAATCLLISILITVRSSNKIPKKWLIMFGIYIAILLVPLVSVITSGGLVGGIRGRRYFSPITFMPEMVELIFLDSFYNSIY